MINVTVKALTRNWWIVALQGIAAIIFGILAWVWPGITVVVLLALFGAYALIDGLIALFEGIGSHTWALILGGIAGIGAGIITFFFPRITALVLLAFIAAWAIITGLLEILAGIELRRIIDNEWLLIVGGIISVVFGVILAVHPGSGALAILWLIGVYAILAGIGQLGLAFRLRSWHQRVQQRARMQ